MTDITDATTEAEAVSVLTKLADGVVPAISLKAADGREYVIRRDDFTLQDVSAPHAAEVNMPKIVTQAPNLQTVSSLISYVNRFKDEDTVIFADIKNNRIIAVIDYHEKARSPDQDPTARLGAHSAILHLPFSQEWDIWTGQNERLMKHVDFASFLEENSYDVLRPGGAELLELCRDLQVKQDMQFGSSIRMGDQVSVSYQKENDATTKSGVSLPVSFDISIPVYFGEQNVSITAFTRRKVDDGKLWLGYKLSRAESIRQREFNRIVSEVESDTAVTTVYGTR